MFMPVHTLILDNRIHRTIRISTNEHEYNLVPSSPYKVLLKVVDGKDTLVISKDDQQVATLPCTNTFTPPQSGTTIEQIKNNSCQFSMNIDDAVYRIIEVHQFLCDPEQAKVWFTTTTSNENPAAAKNTLMFESHGTAMTADDGGGGGTKVPPMLG
jgi:hypothetical protein